MLGYRVIWSTLALHELRACPECCRQDGFISARFGLAAEYACPVHKKALPECCAQCSERVNWRRRGLITCSCGASLAGQPQAEVAPAVFDFLDIVRRKVLRLVPRTDYESGIPITGLAAMDLRSILYLIEVLGKQKATQTLESQPDES
jgi:hypothetical protein